MTDAHAKRELVVFNAFSRAAGIPVVSGSIEKRNHPEPDILCRIDGDGDVAFELVELIDSQYARRIDLLVRTKDALGGYINELSLENRGRFNALYANASLFFRFKENASLSARKKLFPKIFGHLIKLEEGFEGIALKAVQGMKGRFDGVKIRRYSGLVGPIMDSSSVGWLGDPAKNALQSKFDKKYMPKGPVELLAYIDTNPMFPDNVWLPETEKLIKETFSTHHFRRIWIFKFGQNKIKYVYPGK